MSNLTLLKKLVTLSVFLLFVMQFSGCATDPFEKSRDWSAEELFTAAKAAMKEEDYTSAVRYYELLEARAPFGAYAQQGQLEVIYAYYKSNEPESALVAADRFIQLYPTHPNLDYVYYMKGLVTFKMTEGLIDRFVPFDKSQRDQGAMNKSFNSFSELLTRFPNSQYAAEARQRMVFLRNSAAQHEVTVAKYYLERGAYLAAANRAKYVVESFDRTPAMSEALTIMAKSYKIMGMNDLAQDALAVLKQNFPNYEGIQKVEQLTLN